METSKSKPAFGPAKVDNPNFARLYTEMMAWRKENEHEGWPSAQGWVNQVNSRWGIYAAGDFRYRFQKASRAIDNERNGGEEDGEL